MPPDPVEQLHPGVLNQVPPESPKFLYILLNEIQQFSRKFCRRTSDDERWSLAECGLKAPDWQKVLAWASRCPASDAPPAQQQGGGPPAPPRWNSRSPLP